MTNDDTVHDLGKNVDSDELSYFIVEMPPDFTDSEKALKQELSSLRKMKRALCELAQIRKEEKSRVVVKTAEKAKEEAMELLRSGAIQIEDKKERHTFKRKSKDFDEDESSVRISQKPTIKEKPILYANFQRGPKLLPHQSETKLLSTTPTSDSWASFPNSSVNTTSQVCDSGKHVSVVETAASKRKQQLIALSEEEDIDATDGVEEGRSDFDRPIQTLTKENDKGYFPYARSSETTLYVGYHKVTTDFIYQTFQPIGEVVRVRVADHQNHAYVTMATYEMAEKALELDHHMINNRLLRVAHARRPAGVRSGRDQRPFRPFSPNSRYGRGQSYHAVPPTDPRSEVHGTTRDLVTYQDLASENN